MTEMLTGEVWSTWWLMSTIQLWDVTITMINSLHVLTILKICVEALSRPHHNWFDIYLQAVSYVLKWLLVIA